MVKNIKSLILVSDICLIWYGNILVFGGLWKIFKKKIIKQNYIDQWKKYEDENFIILYTPYMYFNEILNISNNIFKPNCGLGPVCVVISPN